MLNIVDGGVLQRLPNDTAEHRTDLKGKQQRGDNAPGAAEIE